jgi:hypothetical protein
MEKFTVEDPSIDNATPLFKELNKHEMYLTVIRLFFKHELHANKHLPGYEQMNNQVDYATDHLKGIKALQGSNG